MIVQNSQMPPKTRESFDSVLAKNLVVARTAARLTQQGLAAAASVSRATIAQLETGYSDPRLSTIIQLAEAIGVSPLLLLVGQHEARALTDLPGWHKAHAINLPEEEVERIRLLLRTGMLKDRAKAARMGSALAAAAGHAGTPEKASAAILSALVPGPGTALGIALAKLLGT